MARERLSEQDRHDAAETDRRTFVQLCGAALALGAGGVSVGRASAREKGTESTDAPLANVLVIVGEGGVSNYEVTVSSNMVPGPDAGALSTTGSRGASAEGAIAAGTHSYWFAGDVTDFRFDGSAAVYLNGEEIDPGILGDTV